MSGLIGMRLGSCAGLNGRRRTCRFSGRLKRFGAAAWVDAMGVAARVYVLNLKP